MAACPHPFRVRRRGGGSRHNVSREPGTSTAGSVTEADEWASPNCSRGPTAVAAARPGYMARSLPPPSSLLLAYHGWSAGRAANLRGRSLLVATCIAVALGLVMIVLKDVVLIHLH